jgi:FtsZ-binding cell division protein ZapB
LAFYLPTFIRACCKKHEAKAAQAYLEDCVQAVNDEEKSRKEQTAANHQAYLQKIEALNAQLKNAAEDDQKRLDSLLDKMREYREGLLRQAEYADEEALADSFDYRSDF